MNTIFSRAKFCTLFVLLYCGQKKTLRKLSSDGQDTTPSFGFGIPSIKLKQLYSRVHAFVLLLRKVVVFESSLSYVLSPGQTLQMSGCLMLPLMYLCSPQFRARLTPLKSKHSSFPSTQKEVLCIRIFFHQVPVCNFCSDTEY